MDNEISFNDVLAPIKEKLDLNHDGSVDIQDIITLAVKLPGIRVDREGFLRKELSGTHSEDEVATAIATTPSKAGIATKEIDKIADEVIKYERLRVSGISAVLGAPGGAAIAATVPMDIVQYYAITLRAVQKLLYLYGFPQLASDESGLILNTQTMNQITICLAAMYGVANANNAVKGMAKALAEGVEKKLLKAALTGGTLYPALKEAIKWFGVRLTKEVFAGFFKKAIPVAGSVVGGLITYLSFKPCCVQLKNALKDTSLSNIEHKDTSEEIIVFNSILNNEPIDTNFEVLGN